MLPATPEPKMGLMEFVNRRAAGRLLAAQLQSFAAERPVVIALPRGGVPVAYEVAAALDAPLDILMVRKIGAPDNPEYAIGAIVEGGTAVFDRATVRRAGITQEQIDRTVAREERELQRRMELYRDGRTAIDLHGRCVIVVDDGIATGLTDLAAVRAVRALGAARIIVAVPVGAQNSLEHVGDEADEVVCHTIPRDFRSVGQWYDDFSPVSDREVITLLADQPARQEEIRLDLGDAKLTGDLTRPRQARGLIIFAHGSGSSRLSPRNQAVASTLNTAGFATLLFDLLTEDEGQRRQLVFNIPLLAHRLELVTRWAQDSPSTRDLPIGYFGASTGAAAALTAAATECNRDVVRAVVSRGGRPDLAADRLGFVTAPTLLIVGGDDTDVLEVNRRAAMRLRCHQKLSVVPGATHLFEEPGTLEAVARLAADWFTQQIAAPAANFATTTGG